MDTISKLKCLFLLLLIIPTCAFSQSAPTGYVDLAGWVKGTDGIYSRAFEGSTRTSPLAGTLKVIGDAPVHTSKGAFTFNVERTAAVDVGRIGAGVAKLARVLGPVGMATTAAALVCELTDICNQAGQWMMNPPATSYEPNSYPATNGQWWGWGSSYYPSPEAACRDPQRLLVNVGSDFTFDHTEYVDDNTYKCFAKRITGSGVFYASNTSKIAGCAPGYTLSGANCLKNGVTPVPATNTDLDNAASKLNDQRFVPELIDKQVDIPIGLPTITNAPKAIISQDTSVTKDANGNVTGTKVTATEAEIVDAATAESPGKVIVKETSTVTNYDINNTVINSTTSTSYTNQPPPDKPVDPITISFDDVPDDAIEHQDVDAELETPESWGDGFCPADETIDYHYGTLTFDFQPTCDFAIGVRPVLIFMASITALFIVAGVKVE